MKKNKLVKFLAYGILGVGFVVPVSLGNSAWAAAGSIVINADGTTTLDGQTNPYSDYAYYGVSGTTKSQDLGDAVYSIKTVDGGANALVKGISAESSSGATAYSVSATSIVGGIDIKSNCDVALGILGLSSTGLTISNLGHIDALSNDSSSVFYSAGVCLGAGTNKITFSNSDSYINVASSGKDDGRGICILGGTNTVENLQRIKVGVKQDGGFSSGESYGILVSTGTNKIAFSGSSSSIMAKSSGDDVYGVYFGLRDLFGVAGYGTTTITGLGGIVAETTGTSSGAYGIHAANACTGDDKFSVTFATNEEGTTGGTISAYSASGVNYGIKLRSDSTGKTEITNVNKIEAGFKDASTITSGDAYGIYVGGGANTVTFTGTDRSITAKTSSGDAYGVYVSGCTISLSDARTISATSTSGTAYGIYVEGGNTTVTGTSVDNKTIIDGAVSVDGTPVTEELYIRGGSVCDPQPQSPEDYDMKQTLWKQQSDGKYLWNDSNVVSLTNVGITGNADVKAGTLNLTDSTVKGNLTLAARETYSFQGVVSFYYSEMWVAVDTSDLTEDKATSSGLSWPISYSSNNVASCNRNVNLTNVAVNGQLSLTGGTVTFAGDNTISNSGRGDVYGVKVESGTNTIAPAATGTNTLSISASSTDGYAYGIYVAGGTTTITGLNSITVAGNEESSKLLLNGGTLNLQKSTIAATDSVTTLSVGGGTLNLVNSNLTGDISAKAGTTSTLTLDGDSIWYVDRDIAYGTNANLHVVNKGGRVEVSCKNVHITSVMGSAEVETYTFALKNIGAEDVVLNIANSADLGDGDVLHVSTDESGLQTGNTVTLVKEAAGIFDLTNLTFGVDDMEAGEAADYFSLSEDKKSIIFTLPNTFKFIDTVMPEVALTMKYAEEGSKAQEYLAGVLTHNRTVEKAAMVGELNALADMPEQLGVMHGQFVASNLTEEAVANHLTLSNKPAGKEIWAEAIHTKETVGWLGLAVNTNQFTAQYNGAVVGADLVKKDKTTLGIALTYVDGKISGNYGKNDSEYYGATLYGSTKLGKDLGVLYDMTYTRGKNDLNFRSHLTGAEITGDQNANSFSLGARLEKEVRLGTSSLTPHIGARWLRMDGGSFTNSLGMSYDSNSTDTIIIPVGIKFRATHENQGWKMSFLADGGYQWNEGDRDYENKVSYNGTKNSFNTDFADQDAWYAGVGLEFNKNNLTFSLGGKHLKSDNTKQNRWFANVSYAF